MKERELGFLRIGSRVRVRERERHGPPASCRLETESEVKWAAMFPAKCIRCDGSRDKAYIVKSYLPLVDVYPYRHMRRLKRSQQQMQNMQSESHR